MIFFQFLYLIYFSIHAAMASPLIGYGASDAVLPAKNQELFYMGFDLGLSISLPGRSRADLISVVQINDGSQLGAIRSAETLISSGVVALAGFPTSHEALLVAKIAKREKLFALFAGAGHSDLASFGDTVFTTGESMQYATESFLKFVQKAYPKSKGLIISNPYAIFSKNQEDILLATLRTGHFSSLSLSSARLSKDLLLPDNALQELSDGKYTYIFLTPYADESVHLMEQLENHHIDIPIITNSSWTTGDVEYIRRFLAKRKTPAFSATNWIRGSIHSLPFETLVKKRYGRDAAPEVAYGYDLGIILGTVLGRVKGPVTREAFLEAFRRSPCFENTTSGRLCFPASGGHALRNINYVQFTKSGFLPIERK